MERPRTEEARHPTPYELAQRSGQEALRRTLLDTASRLLVAEGPGALTMRRVAGADALYREGFERLRRRLEAVAGDDPPARLRALGHAYRANALAERAYYGVMFQQAIPGFRPSAASLTAAGASLEVLARAVRAAMDAGALRPGDPQPVAEVLWAAVHGVVSLELAGQFPHKAAAAHRLRTQATAPHLPFLSHSATPRRR